ncbi:hypothetical protein RchiOBHm_Chr1g0331281 [Rosa chinensis]|uniref:Uncharacterized protein n=1 Tax=Rosa chinensis TaxID=74649 RepID=A0A2P6SBH0_ROSCH|nr:hypothetical protein RchiOBHm_Chr1g0331281 [Rosa chinensis]
MTLIWLHHQGQLSSGSLPHSVLVSSSNLSHFHQETHKHSQIRMQAYAAMHFQRIEI